MFWGQTRPRTPCHQFGTILPSTTQHSALKTTEQPVLGAETFCLKTGRNTPSVKAKRGAILPSLKDKKGNILLIAPRHPAAHLSVRMVHLFRTSCSGQNNALPQKAGTACLWGDDILFEIGCQKVCEKCSPFFSLKCTSHPFEQPPALRRVTICLTERGNSLPSSSSNTLPTPHLPLACPLGQVV